MCKSWLSIVAISVALSGLLGAGAAKLESPLAGPATHAEINGTVVDSAGKPVQGATVRIWVAWIRVGSSPYCPSCWADCAKTATSDAAGRFEFKSLDPRLEFRLLFVAKGYEPKFADADPQEHKPLKAKLKSRASLPKDPRQIVSGQVVDSRGRPVADAIVEPFGAKDDTRRHWGGMRGTDPLVVTDQSGRFEIVSDHPAEGFDLKVTARAMAPRKFALVPTADSNNHLVITEGATVRGRIVDHGRPIAGVNVRMVQSNRRPANFLGMFDIGTDAHGEYLYANVPPEGDYVVYGTMDSLRDRGSSSIREIHVGGDGSETKVGDLSIGPAFRVSGRLVLSDGKPLPPHTRIHVSRDELMDGQIIDVDPSGAFTARGIPPGLVELNAGGVVDGYHLSDKNLSFEPRNGFFLEGLVQKDIDGLVVLLEPGDWKRIDRELFTQDDWRKFSATEDRIKVEPLSGAVAAGDGYKPIDEIVVERPRPTKKTLSKIELPKIELPPPLPKPVSADANVPKRAIVGRVVDPSGKPVAGANVQYHLRRDLRTDGFTVHTKSGADGRFKLEFPIQWLPQNATEFDVAPDVVADAPGYGWGFGDALAQILPNSSGKKQTNTAPLEVKLEPGISVEFTVLTPDGKPLAGARIQNGSEWQTTDLNGRARVSGLRHIDFAMVGVEAAGYGTQRFIFDSRTKRNFVLQFAPVGRIEGQVIAAQPELYRGMHLSINTWQRSQMVRRKGTNKAKSADDDRPDARGNAELQVGADGRFVIPAIAIGALQIRAEMADDRLPVRPRVIDGNRVEVEAGRTTRIEIPMEMLVKVHGVIRAKETGKPMAGAQLIIAGNNSSWRDVVRTDAEGRYTARVLPGEVQVMIYKQHWKNASDDIRTQRYAVPDDVTDFEMPVVDVGQSKDVEGLLLDKDGKPGPQSIIYASAGEKMFSVVAWEQGKFEFRDVPDSAVFDKFRISSTGPDGHDLSFTVQSKVPLVLRLK